MKTLLLWFFLTIAAPNRVTVAVPEPTLHAVRSLSYAPSVERELGRVAGIAADAFDVASDSRFDSKLFVGSRSVEATTLLLWAVVYYESGLRPHIERCDCTQGDGDCDHGHALGLPQLHALWLQGRSAPEVCGDRHLQLWLALSGPLLYAKTICGRSLVAALGAYNSPAALCAVTKYGSSTYATFQKLIEKAGIVVRVQGKTWSAESR